MNKTLRDLNIYQIYLDYIKENNLKNNENVILDIKIFIVDGNVRYNISNAMKFQYKEELKS